MESVHLLVIKLFFPAHFLHFLELLKVYKSALYNFKLKFYNFYWFPD